MGVEGDLIIAAPERPAEPDGFRAFVSYSHQSDKRTAAWVQKAIESYRVPRQLRRRQPADRPLPARLYPVFRDRMDLRAGASLHETITQALRSSRALIVICSPEAARSPWVDLEIRTFAACHPGAPILAVIAAGDAADDPTPCFPPALLERHDEPDAAIVRTHDPIAADLRRGGDGRRMARLKLVAGLLDVDVFQLARRDDQRRLRRVLLAAALALLVAAVLALALWQAIAARREAEAQRAAAFGFASSMNSVLRQQMEGGSNIAVSRMLGKEVLGWFNGQDPEIMTPEQVMLKVGVLWKDGQNESNAGNFSTAATKFREAASYTAGLLVRSPEDGERVFDHAQSVYWVGYIDWRLRRLDAAETAFRQYEKLAALLIRIDPHNLKWQPEPGYAASNLGTLLLERGENRRAELAFRKVLSVSQRAVKAKPGDEQLLFDLAQSHSWVADALARRGRFAEALKERQTELRLYDGLNNSSWQMRRRIVSINSHIACARLRNSLGLKDDAIHEMSQALKDARMLYQTDIQNQNWADLAAIALLGLADLQMSVGSLSDSLHLLLSFDEISSKLMRWKKPTPEWECHRATAKLIRAKVFFARNMLEQSIQEAKKSELIASQPMLINIRSAQLTETDAISLTIITSRLSKRPTFALMRKLKFLVGNKAREDFAFAEILKRVDRLSTSS